MDFEHSFIAPRSGARLLALARQHLEGAGYRRASEKPLVFERGSLWGTWMSFTPSKWHVRASVGTRLVGVERTEVVLTLHVNTSGQMVMDEERAYWESELNAFERAVTTGEVDGTSLSRAAETLGAEMRRWVATNVIGASILIVVTSILAYFVKKIIN